MQTRQDTLLNILADEEALFALPLYQRAYAWQHSQCRELWRDIMLSAQDKQSHFAGMIICSSEEDSASANDAAFDVDRAPNTSPAARYIEIIDGQQRMTTTFLMVLAFAHYAQEHGITFYGAGSEYLIESFLTSPYGRKLTLCEDDRHDLFALLDGAPVPEDSRSRVLANYRFFRELMDEEGFDDELFWRGINSVYVILIQLDADDDPQEVFESFNSKGVSLGIADMLRNHLLVAESLPEQERLYSTYWERVQNAFGDDAGSKRLNACLRAWVTVRCKHARGHSDREMFAAFKEYSLTQLAGRTEQCLREMVNFTAMWAERYRYHATKAYVSYNWATLGATSLVSEELREKVHADENSWYWQHYMTVDSTK